jgi:hypothetical protein
MMRPASNNGVTAFARLNLLSVDGTLKSLRSTRALAEYAKAPDPFRIKRILKHKHLSTTVRYLRNRIGESAESTILGKPFSRQMLSLEAWLAIREQKKGALFVAFSPHGETRIEGRLVAEVVKRLFRDAGASSRDVDAIGAHSLRRGFVTSADIAGATTAQIMDVTGHRDPKSLRRYSRREVHHDPVLPKLF